MTLFSFWKPSSKPELAEPVYPPRINDEIRSLLTDLPFGKEICEEHIIPAIDLILKTYDKVPASEKHHHTEPWGLFIHSIEVARLVSSQLSTVVFCKDNSLGGARFLVEDRWRVAAILAALFHDAGKVIFDIRTTPGYPRQFQNQYIPIDSYNWNPARRHKNHETVSVFYLGSMLRPETRSYLLQYDPTILEDLILAIDGKPTHSRLGEILTRADALSVERYMSEKFTGPFVENDAPSQAQLNQESIVPNDLLPNRNTNDTATPQQLIETLIEQIRQGNGEFLVGPVTKANNNQLKTNQEALTRICSLHSSVKKPLLVGLIGLRPDISLTDTEILVSQNE